MATKAAPWGKANPRTKAGKPHKKLAPKKKTAAKSIARSHGRSKPSLVDNMLAARGKSAKNAVTKKAATKKSAAKKSPSKKTSTAKRTAPKKSAPAPTRKKTATRKAAKKTARKTPAKKTPSKKTPAKKTPARKRVAKTGASNRSTHAAISSTKSVPARSPTGARIKDPHGGLTAAGRRAFSEAQGAHLRPGVTKPVSEMSADDMRRKGSWAVRFYGRKTLPPLVDGNGEPTRLALSAHAWGEPVPKTEEDARKIAERGRDLLERYKAAKDK